VIVAAALVSVALFLLAFWFFRVIGAATAAAVTAQRAVAVMRDSRLDDRARERAMRRASLELFSGFASILVRSLSAVAFAALPIWAIDALGLAPARSVVGFLSRWEVIVTTTVVTTLGFFAWTRWWPSS
jgi:hypothetical protein